MLIGNSMLWIGFVFLILPMVEVFSLFSDIPSLPTRPERFSSRKELRRYLQLIHEYYAIIGQPRLGRSNSEAQINETNRIFSELFHIINQKSIDDDQYKHRFRK